MKAQVLIMVLVSSFLFQSCGQKEESPISSGGGKHPVTLSMGSYTTANNSYNPLSFLIPTAHAAVSELKFCFKRLRFKRDLPEGTPDTTEDNVDLELGEIVISNSGTLLGTVSVPADTYKRIEFDLEPNCDGVALNSVSLSNGNGTFNTSDTLTVKFEGTFVVDGTENLELGVQNILDAANSFDGLGGTSLKDALEAVSGNL